MRALSVSGVCALRVGVSLGTLALSPIDSSRAPELWRALIHPEVLLLLPLFGQHLDLSEHLPLPLRFHHHLAVQVFYVEVLPSHVRRPQHIEESAVVSPHSRLTVAGVHSVAGVLERGRCVDLLVSIHKHGAVLLRDRVTLVAVLLHVVESDAARRSLQAENLLLVL